MAERTCGEGQLGSSTFRAITEIAPDFAQLYGDQAARIAVRLKALNDFHRALAGAVSLDALLELLLDQLFAAPRPEEGVILLRQAGGAPRTAASRRLPGAAGALLVSLASAAALRIRNVELAEAATSMIFSWLATRCGSSSPMRPGKASARRCSWR